MLRDRGSGARALTRRAGKGAGQGKEPRGGPARTKAPSQRQLRVGEELRHALARVLTRNPLSDPALAGVTLTVTEVRLSPDLRNATAFVVPLGGAGLEPVVRALNRAAAFLRGQLAREVRLRHLPRLAFAADRTFDQARRVHDILERPHVRQDLVGEPGGGTGEEP